MLLESITLRVWPQFLLVSHAIASKERWNLAQNVYVSRFCSCYYDYDCKDMQAMINWPKNPLQTIFCQAFYPGRATEMTPTQKLIDESIIIDYYLAIDNNQTRNFFSWWVTFDNRYHQSSIHIDCYRWKSIIRLSIDYAWLQQT